MKDVRTVLRLCAGWLGMLVWSVLPALAQETEEHAAGAEAAETPLGMAFRWLNFILVFGAIAYLIRKIGLPYFRGKAESIAGSIRSASEARDAAQQRLRGSEEGLATLDREIEDLRRTATQESAREAERIRGLTHVESEKIAQAARAEIEAAERAARQELRAIAARVATERAAALVKARLDRSTETALFRAFVAELERSAP
jgi:F0F1-type ATP synthase membrane subunit b/b'